jgi:tRNA nucleotidyltransferase (CCA-adding enzyme)
LAQRVTVLQQHSLGSSALSPKTWPFDIGFLPPETHLVGGSVRDALLERHSDYLDLDFVMPQGAVETAATIARHYRAGFVLLDAERQIARVVFRQGTADFAQQVGDSLEADLFRRDFTMNAIAYNPHTLELIDPLNGCLDLEHCIVRMVSAENLAEDPLRLLRAYRQAAQLGFTMHPETAAAARKLAPQLKTIAAERVQSEFHYLLTSKRGPAQLKAAWEAGLLSNWFESAGLLSLEKIDRLETLFQLLKSDWPLLHDLINQPIRAQSSNKSEPKKNVEMSGGRRSSWLTMAKLASLMPDDVTIAETQLWQLKYSRSEIHAVLTVLKTLPKLQALLNAAPDMALSPNSDTAPDNRRAQYALFQQVGVVFPALCIQALASGIEMAALRPLINRYLDPEDVVAHPVPVLSGQDLMSHLDLPPSPQIGRLLAALQVARAEGLIETQGEAIAFARRILEQDS